MSNTFANKDTPADKPSKGVLFIRVMQGDAQKVSFGRFDTTVGKAIDTICSELNLTNKINEEMRIKYFLYRISDHTDDGIEILAEVDPDGQPVLLSDYSIQKNGQLNMGALVISNKDSKDEIENESINVIEETENIRQNEDGEIQDDDEIVTL